MPFTDNSKVAYITKMFPRFSETFILGEILELERTGVEVHIFSLKLPNDARRHADVDRVQALVNYLPQSTLPLLGPHLGVASRHPLGYLKAAVYATRRSVKSRSWSSFRRFLQAGFVAAQLEKVEISHVHAHFGSSATSVARDLHIMLGSSFSFTAHAKDIFIDSVSRTSLIRKLQLAQFVVTVSDFNVRHLRTLEPATNITRIYNGLDLDLFERRPLQPQETPMILAVGRLVEKKGFDDLIRACRVLRDRGIRFHCEIIGTGNDELKLHELIDGLELGDVVSLPGAMPREELLTRYPQASVFAAPCVVGSDGNRDGLPTVLIEAMALGVPVVATPVTGIPELVRDGETGVIVPERDPVALADAIADVLSNPEHAGQMATCGRHLVEREFNLRKNVRRLRELFAGAGAA